MKTTFLKFVPLLVAFFLLFYLIVNVYQPSPTYYVNALNELTYDTKSSLTFYTTAEVNSGDSLYFNFVNTPLKVFINDIIVYDHKPGDSTPSNQVIPPIQYAILPIPNNVGNTIDIAFEFSSASIEDISFEEPILLGDSNNIYYYLFVHDGFSVLLGAFLITLEILLAIIGALTMRNKLTSSAFFWLSLFALNTSTWVLCDCNLTVLISEHPSLLYILAYFALFFFLYPLLRFAMLIIDFKHKLLLQLATHLIMILICVSLMLQIEGSITLIDISHTAYIINMFSLCLLVVMLFLEAKYLNNLLAKKFLFPFCTLLLFSCLEIANYFLSFLNLQKSLYIQIGVFLFTLYSTILLKTYMQDNINTQLRNEQLASNIHMLSNQINHQKEHYALMVEHSALLRRQRHDLHHQLSVIRYYNDIGDSEKLRKYLDELTHTIPTAHEVNYCENNVVNSVVHYYLSVAKECKIDDFQIHIQLTNDIGNIYESDLCIIIGNMLENAIHACMNLESPFIHIHGKKVNDYITISVSNSCSQVRKNFSGTFLSTKKFGKGIGLFSIESVVNKYNGTTKFEEKNNIFSSFVYLSTK